jgi:hypothetical protein
MKKVQAAEAFTSILRGQCSPQGPESRTGRFCQLWAEPEVRSCDPGHQPVPRQIRFVEERKTHSIDNLTVSTRFTISMVR